MSKPLEPEEREEFDASDASEPERSFDEKPDEYPEIVPAAAVSEPGDEVRRSKKRGSTASVAGPGSVAEPGDVITRGSSLSRRLVIGGGALVVLGAVASGAYFIYGRGGDVPPASKPTADNVADSGKREVPPTPKKKNVIGSTVQVDDPKNSQSGKKDQEETASTSDSSHTDESNKPIVAAEPRDFVKEFDALADSDRPKHIADRLNNVTPPLGSVEVDEYLKWIKVQCKNEKDSHKRKPLRMLEVKLELRGGRPADSEASSAADASSGNDAPVKCSDKTLQDPHAAVLNPQPGVAISPAAVILVLSLYGHFAPEPYPFGDTSTEWDDHSAILDDETISTIDRVPSAYKLADMCFKSKDFERASKYVRNGINLNRIAERASQTAAASRDVLLYRDLLSSLVSDILEARFETQSKELSEAQTELRRQTDDLSTAQSNLNSAQTKLKEALAEKVDSKALAVEFARQGIQDYLKSIKLVERLEALQPKEPSEPGSAENKEVYDQRLKSWNEAIESVRTIANRVQEKSPDRTPESDLKDYASLRDTYQLLMRWEAESSIDERMAGVANLNVPATNSGTVGKDQIAEEFKKGGRLSDLVKRSELPKDLIGKADTRDFAKRSELPKDLIGKADIRDFAKRSELPKDLIGKADIRDFAKRNDLPRDLIGEAAIRELIKNSPQSPVSLEQMSQLKQTLAQEIRTAIANVTGSVPDDQQNKIVGETTRRVLETLASYGFVPPPRPQDLPDPKTRTPTPSERERAMECYCLGLSAYFSKRSEDLAQAVQKFSQAVEFDPHNPAYRYYLGLSLHRQEQYIEAGKQVRTGAILEGNPTVQFFNHQIGAQLERVQGPRRAWLENIRRTERMSLAPSASDSAT